MIAYCPYDRLEEFRATISEVERVFSDIKSIVGLSIFE